MGAYQTEQQSKYIVVNHCAFGNTKQIIEDHQCRLSTQMIIDYKDYRSWLSMINKYNIKSEFLLLPVSHHIIRDGFCNSKIILAVQYPQYQFLLSDQIQNKGKSRFTQVQLWYLLFSLLAAKKQISPFSMKVGDIRPQNIFINDKGQLKVANIFSWPNQQTNYIKAFFNKQICYLGRAFVNLAPQQIKMNTSLVRVDSHYSQELFSIGLTVLGCGLLTDCRYLYNLEQNKFNYQLHQQIQNQWITTHYSQVFKAIIYNLIQIKPQARMTVEQLTTWIEKYQSPIRNLTNFVINDAPCKVHQAVMYIRNLCDGKRFVPNAVSQIICVPTQNYKHNQTLYPIHSNQQLTDNLANQIQQNSSKKIQRNQQALDQQKIYKIIAK